MQLVTALNFAIPWALLLYFFLIKIIQTYVSILCLRMFFCNIHTPECFVIYSQIIPAKQRQITLLSAVETVDCQFLRLTENHALHAIYKVWNFGSK